MFVPLSAQILSDIGLHFVGKAHDVSIGYSLVLVVAYAVVVAVGWVARKRPSPFKLLGASIIGTLLFYLVTNTFSFWQDPGYVKNFAGWVQSLTLGLPGYPPTYVFLFKSMAGDLLFTSLVILAVGVGVSKPEPAADEVPEPEPTEA